MRPFQWPSTRRTIWIPKMPQDQDGIPPAPDPAGTLLVPNFDGQTYAVAAGIRVIPSVTNGV